MPRSIEECRQRSEERDRLAETATSAHVRETMLYLAERSHILADQEEAKDRRAKPQRTRPQHPSEFE